VTSSTDSKRRPPLPRPPWLKVRIPVGEALERVNQRMERGALHTVCQEAHCPNIYECFASGTATFLILGEVCTRKCGFCAISKGTPSPVDRDDLPDGGAGQFVAVLEALHRSLPEATTEVLVPDFRPDPQGALDQVIAADPTIFAHNVETVRRLYPAARPGSVYEHSLALLTGAATRIGGNRVKCSLILGLGERDEELREAIGDIYAAGARRLNLGQYLAPSSRHIPVKRYYTPDEFRELGEYAESLGFTKVESGPLVRSSYHAKP
jgi:lipoic acid synthetase